MRKRDNEVGGLGDLWTVYLYPAFFGSIGFDFFFGRVHEGRAIMEAILHHSLLFFKSNWLIFTGNTS